MMRRISTCRFVGDQRAAPRRPRLSLDGGISCSYSSRTDSNSSSSFIMTSVRAYSSSRSSSMSIGGFSSSPSVSPSLGGRIHCTETPARWRLPQLGRFPLFLAIGVGVGGWTAMQLQEQHHHVSRSRSRGKKGRVADDIDGIRRHHLNHEQIAFCSESDEEERGRGRDASEEKVREGDATTKGDKDVETSHRIRRNDSEGGPAAEAKGFDAVQRCVDDGVVGSTAKKEKAERDIITPTPLVSVLSPSTSDQSVAGAAGEKIPSTATPRSLPSVGRHYVHLISPAARRHLIKVYRLAIGGIVFVVTGFTCGLAWYKGEPFGAEGARERAAALALSGFFEVPAGLLASTLAALAEALGRFLQARNNNSNNNGGGGAGEGSFAALLISTASTLSTLTSVSLPIWAPFAAVFVAMAALAVSSWAEGKKEEACASSVSHRSEEGEENRRRRLVDARRKIFFAMSFAEGALIVPLAKALLLTNFVFLSLVSTFAVVMGFTVVAMYRGGTTASSSHNDDNKKKGIIYGDEEEQEEVGGDYLSGKEMKEASFAPQLLFDARDDRKEDEQPPLLKTSAFVVEGMACGGVITYGLLQLAASFSTMTTTGCMLTSSILSPVLGALLTGLGGFSPIAVTLVAGAASLFVAKDTNTVLEGFGDCRQLKQHDVVTMRSDKEDADRSLGDKQPHMASFFIHDEDDDEDFVTDLVDAGVGLVLAAVGVAVRFADVVAEVSWGNDLSSSFIVGCNELGDRCMA